MEPCRPSRDERACSKVAIASRLRSIGSEIFGAPGCAQLAPVLGLPPASWSHYESGVRIPGEVQLRFLDITGTEPSWLLSGEGPSDRVSSPIAPASRHEAKP